jgi:serine/threonine protein phosphatase PrpC
MIQNHDLEPFAVWAATDIGKVRLENQDRVGAGDTVLNLPVGKFEVQLFPEVMPVAAVVADGVGGGRGGSVAAELAVTAFLNRSSEIKDVDSLTTTVDAISEGIRQACSQEASTRGAATTLAGIVFLRSGAIAFNVGDSRIYRVGKRELSLISQDHVSQSDSRMLTRFLGGNLAFSSPYCTEIPNWYGHRYLICSDGLFGSVKEAQILQLAMIVDGGHAVDALVAAAIEAGAPDNVTVALCGTLN